MRNRPFVTQILFMVVLWMVLPTWLHKPFGALAFESSHNQEIAKLKPVPNQPASGPPSQWIPRGPGGGGALFAPSFSPHNPNELFISCDMSEVFHSANLGVTWDLSDFRQIQGNRESQVRFTSNPAILYALDYTGDVVTPSKSTDGGATWNRLSSDPTFGESYSLFADPNNSTNLIVSDYSHIYLSTDGGSTFAQKFSTSSGNGCFVAGAFFDGSSIYAGTNLGLLVSVSAGPFTTASVGGIPSSQSMVSFAGSK